MGAKYGQRLAQTIWRGDKHERARLGGTERAPKKTKTGSGIAAAAGQRPLRTAEPREAEKGPVSSDLSVETTGAVLA